MSELAAAKDAVDQELTAREGRIAELQASSAELQRSVEELQATLGKQGTAARQATLAALVT